MRLTIAMILTTTIQYIVLFDTSKYLYTHTVPVFANKYGFDVFTPAPFLMSLLASFFIGSKQSGGIRMETGRLLFPLTVTTLCEPISNFSNSEKVWTTAEDKTESLLVYLAKSSNL